MNNKSFIDSHQPIKFVFTGGHHNSALEVLKLIKHRLPDSKFLWLGHRHTSLKNKNDSAEYREITSAGVQFIDLRAGKFFRVYNIIYFLRIPYGFFQAMHHLIKFKPDMIVSFGGYLAVPTVLAGYLLKIPSVTHEQTSVAGLANIVVGRLAKKVFITWPASAKYFPKSKTILTGLPLRKSILSGDADLFKFGNKLPTIYITGGKQGSHVINLAIAEKLSEILKLANVIHQTGANTETGDNQMLTNARRALPNDLQSRYMLKDFIYEKEIGSVFKITDIVVSRAGAHIIYELIATGKPSILIPIPNTSHDEQVMNALMIENMGLGILLRQNKLTGENLYEAILKMVNNISKYKKNTEKARLEIKTDATEKIADEIIKLVSSN